MREITLEEAAEVNGGIGLVIAGILGAGFVFGYGVGKDLAERENAR